MITVIIIAIIILYSYATIIVVIIEIDIAMLLCYYSPGPARGRAGWSGAYASTRKYFV